MILDALLSCCKLLQICKALDTHLRAPTQEEEKGDDETKEKEPGCGCPQTSGCKQGG